MERRPFGQGGPEVPILGIGTWMMEQDSRPDAVRAIRRALELGMTHLDTAEMYGTGRVEEIVGEAIRGIREKVYLVSKVLPSNASFQGTLQACEKSLRRLGTDRLDCYLLHWPGSHPLAETIRAFEKLRTDGKVRSYGVSNFDVKGMEEAVSIAGPGRIACNQVLYNLAERTVEHAVLPWCQKHGVAVVAYSPVCAQRFPESDPLRDLAAARGATPRQLALAYLLAQPSVFAIPKTSNLAHLEENAGSASLRLSPSERSRIDAAFPRGPWRGLATA
ncbi:MAG TPA: aldo/keto reductase [Planctomycetota bacterium]|nr:aldo/keto reductase [Planctomycetota bacterium]